MEKAVDSLAHQFKKLSTDLHYVAHRLENSSSSSLSSSLSHKKRSNEALNPVRLCKRVRALQAELVVLRRESLLLTEEKEQATLSTTRLLVANARLLRNIQSAANGTGVDEEVEDEAAASLAKIIDLQQAHAAAKAGSTTSCFGLAYEEWGAAVMRTGGADGRRIRSVVKSSPVALTSSAAEPAAHANDNDEDASLKNDTSKKSMSRRKKTKPTTVREVASPALPKSFVSERSFGTVPISVRGRSKRNDVNETLRLIRAFAHGEISPSENNAPNQNAKSAAALQLAHLTEAGAKVSGYTGKCILGTLRSLKYISIHPTKGITLLQ